MASSDKSRRKATPATTQGQRVKAASGAGKSIILFVEDDENDVVLVSRALEKAGIPHEIAVVDDSRSAIECLALHPRLAHIHQNRLPDLLLLDLKLVGSSGFEVLTWMSSRQDLSHVRKIVFSSSWVQTDVEKALELGADDYMVKPSGFQDLVNWGKELDSRWLANRVSAG